jgi:hypothetical protein
MTDSKYSKGKIYAIRSKLTDTLYIGSTCQTLNKRFGEHNGRFKNYKVGNDNLTSFIILANGDAFIELIEDFPCSSKKELECREGEFILKHKDKVVNKLVAGRTDAEYYSDNRTKIVAYKSVQNTCDCGGKYRNDCKARHMRTILHQTYIASISVTKP